MTVRFRRGLYVIILLLSAVLGGLVVIKSKKMGQVEPVSLPEPRKHSQISLEEAIAKRRSVREYQDKPLSLREISQILWSAQGITDPKGGGRTVPSAGALYPLELYLVVRKAEELAAGIYHYLPSEHRLEKIKEGDLSLALAQAALGQVFVKEASINLVFAAFFERTTQKYGQRGVQYVWMEAGHAAQNVYLQVQSLNLGTVVIGAFNDEEIQKLLNLSAEEKPLYLMPVGRI